MTDPLLPWLRGNGVTYDAGLLSIEGRDPGTMSIRAKQSIISGSLLATIPKAACITRCTTEIAEILSSEGFSGGLGLVIAVWYEAGIGQRSKWYGYFTSMNDREYLPIFWDKAELARLEGTEIAADDVASDIQDIVDDYEDHVVPLMQKYREVFDRVSERGRGLEAFMNAASLVASRAFAVDMEHGDGMVPLADVFNHKVSVVCLNEEYGINGVDDGEASDQSDHSNHSDQSDLSGQDDDDDKDDKDDKDGQVEDNDREYDSNDRTPEASSDTVSHVTSDESPSRQPKRPRTAAYPAVQGDTLELCGMTEANGMHLRLHIAIIDDEESDCLQIVAASDVEQGKEVFNCYGELSNDVLLKKYGFCLPENPFSYVTLDKTLIVEHIWGCKGESISKQHPFANLYDEIRDQTSLLDDDAEPFMVHSNRHINLALFAFLRMIIDGASTTVKRGPKEDGENILDNPRITEAMERGLAVPLSQALQLEDPADERRHWVDKCQEALRLACVARSHALTRANHANDTNDANHGTETRVGRKGRDDGLGESDVHAECLRDLERSILGAFHSETYT